MKRRSFIKSVGTAATALSFHNCSVFNPINRYSNYKPKGVIPRRTLGKTGIKVSVLGFGSHLKKELIAKPEYRDRMIKLGFEGGINLFDVYDHSEYKQFIPMGKSLREFRKEAVISLVSVEKTKNMQTEIDGALEDFKTDYIDLYRLYTVDDDKMNIIEKNKKAGKIRAIGVVEHNVDKITAFLDRYGDSLDYVMIIYNFHHNKAILFKDHRANDFSNNYSKLIPRLEQMNLGIIGMKPMGSDAMIELARTKKFFKNTKANVAKAMLRYVYQRQEIDVTIPAMNSIEELITNLESIYNPSLSSYEEHLLHELSEIASSTQSAYLPDHYKWLEKWSSKTA